VRSLTRYASGTGLVAAAAGWGSAAVTVKIASGGLPAAVITLVELSVAVPLLWIAVLVHRWREPGIALPRPTWGLLLLGLLEPALAFVFINLGITLSSAATASLIIGLQSGFIIAIAAVFFHLRPTRLAWFALAIGLVGVILVTGGKPQASSVVGDLLVFIGMIVASASVVVASRIAQNTDATTMTAWQFTFGWLLVVPLTAILWKAGYIHVHTPVAAKYWLAAAVTGLVGSAMAFLIYNWALGRVSVGLAAMAINLIPVFGVFFAVVFLGESFQGVAIVGAVLVFIGLILFSIDSRSEAAATRVASQEVAQTRSTAPTAE